MGKRKQKQYRRCPLDRVSRMQAESAAMFSAAPLPCGRAKCWDVHALCCHPPLCRALSAARPCIALTPSETDSSRLRHICSDVAFLSHGEPPEFWSVKKEQHDLAMFLFSYAISLTRRTATFVKPSSTILCGLLHQRPRLCFFDPSWLTIALDVTAVAGDT